MKNIVRSILALAMCILIALTAFGCVGPASTTRFSLLVVEKDKRFGNLLKEGRQLKSKFDLNRALKVYQKGLDLANEANNKPAIGTFLHLIGSIYDGIGNPSKALPYLEQANQIFKEIGDTLSQCLVLDLLGFIQRELGNYQEAMSYFEQSSKMSTIFAVGSDINIAAIYIEQGKFEEAFQIIQSIRIARESVSSHYYLKKGEYKRAKEEFNKYLTTMKKASKIMEKDYNLSRVDLFLEPYIGLGLSCEGLEEYSQAKDFFQKAIQIIEMKRQALTVEQREEFFGKKISFFTYREPYEGMIRILLKEKAEGYMSYALYFAERSKARSFLDTLEIKLRGNEGENPKDKEVLERDRKFQERLSELKNRGAMEEFQNTRVQYEEFIKEVKFQSSELASLISVNPASVKDIQSYLDKDVTLLEYYTTPSQINAWLLTKDEVKAYEITVKERELKEKIDRFLLPNITNKTRKPEPVITLATDDEYKKETSEVDREGNRKKFYQIATDFYNTILAPVEKDIKTEKLIIVPHGILHKVPFSTLSDGKKYLIDKYAISVLPSASVIEFIVKKRKAEKEKLIAFANPQTEYVPLGFAEVEGKTLSTLFPKGEVYYREKATETLAKERSSDFNIIHFATHGEFNDRQPLQSGLLLAKDNENDGFLQVHEIFGMDLANANLVTLSACETALSKITGGDDLVGLSRGFIYAGTPSLLATLWKVDDQSTAILMEHFYKNWQSGMSKPEALRQAQISLKAMPQYKHPFYWAPFVMVGDWK